jgi:single-stranded-DNA-specific exonuclease
MDSGYSRLVKDEHIKFSVKQGRSSISHTGIGFYMSEKFPIVSSHQPFDMVFTIDEIEWNGKMNLQLKVIDIRSSKS